MMSRRLGAMQGEQRAHVHESELEPQDRLWRPFTVHGREGEKQQPRRAYRDDKYVVVEDIDDGRVVFEISSWPRIDEGGRLYFEGDPAELYDDLISAQRTIDEARKGDGVTGSGRPLRVGDVFVVRGLPKGANSIGQAATIRDVSLAARQAAKAALLGAAASTVQEEYVESMEIELKLGEPVPRRGQFDVRQEPKTRRSALPGDEGRGR